MKHFKWTAPVFALGLFAMPAQAEPAHAADRAQQAEQEEARIHFVNHRGIRNFRVGDDETLYIEGRDRQWYKATLAFAPHSLHFSQAIAIDTGGLSTFDRSSAVIVGGVRVPLRSLVEVEGPPSRDDRKA